jgi:hypothetical protein
MLGGQPSETDQRVDRSGLEIANQAGPVLRTGHDPGSPARQDRSALEAITRLSA